MLEHLPCGGVEQVRAAYDVVDALRGIVDDHGQLVGPGAVRAPQHEIADLCGNVLLHRAVNPVIEADDGTVGNPQPDRGIRTPRAGPPGTGPAPAAGQAAAGAVALAAERVMYGQRWAVRIGLGG